MHVSNLTKNLMLVSQLTEQAYKVEFEGNHYWVKNNITIKVIAKAVKDG